MATGKKAKKSGNRLARYLFFGFLAGILLMILGNRAIKMTSSDEFCASCHVHPHSTQSWKLSTHYDNERGIVIHCIECHLPPEGIPHLAEKAKTGIRDVYGAIFKDVSKINWEEKSQLEYAKKHTYKEACLHCHQNLFPIGLSREGDEAHLYYSQHPDELRCINCHLYTGHYSEDAIHAKNVDFGKKPEKPKKIFNRPARVDTFANFTETVPGTSSSFEMVAIPGGRFTLGSPQDEPFREKDEGPRGEVEISPFFLAKTEVTWDEYLSFFAMTASEGRTSDTDKQADAETGPTPPWGNPGQGWGKGSRPAITMTHHAAEYYCQWLSEMTGKKYRLPTEAEWEYAARAGTTGPYFFEGDPRKYSEKGFMKKIFGSDTSTINTYVIYHLNSQGKTGLPSEVKPNPFGLVNMPGNVSEFCSDWYAPDAYEKLPENLVKDPQGPAYGEEHVIRGGSFKSDAGGVRSASREHTRSIDWLKTDPQIPKSIWWYSDCNHVGFRVVCEWNPKNND